MKIVIFDTETTGLLKPDDAPLEDQPKVIEFYGVAINENFEILSELETFIDPQEPLTKEITRITGIKDSDVIGAPTFDGVASSINLLFKDADMAVAHNIAFDNGMMQVMYDRIGKEREMAVHQFCTVDALKPEYGRRIALGALYKKLFGSYFKAHRAKNDVQALVRCFHHFVESGVFNLELYQD